MIISNVQLSFARLETPSKFDERSPLKYSVRIEFPKERLEELSKFCAEGFLPKPLDNGMFGINIKTNATSIANPSKSLKPIVLNADGTRMSPDFIEKIGNGSMADISVNRYQNKNTGKWATQLKGVKVTNYVEYKAADESDFDIVEGKESNAVTTTQADF